MTEDALDEIRRLRERLAAIERAAGLVAPPPTFTTSQLNDRAFYLANRDAIMAAASAGRIVVSEPEPPVRVEYPPSEIPGWTPVGRDMYEAPAPTKKEEPK